MGAFEQIPGILYAVLGGVDGWHLHILGVGERLRTSLRLDHRRSWQ